MSAEIKVTPSSAIVNGSKDASVTPQFVSILNGKRSELFAEADKDGIRPVSQAPRHCVGNPPPPCYGQPPPCYGQPPPCYGGR